jgi:hypothetical protein
MASPAQTRASKNHPRAEAEVYPLTICWRCDASIIAEAQAQVPEIKQSPMPNGQVLTIDFADDNFLNLPENPATQSSAG